MISGSFLPTIGGLQIQLKYLIESLAEQGVEIYFLSYSDGERFINIKYNGFPKFIRLKHKNSILGCVELYKIIKKISPQIIHIHSAERQAFQISILKMLKFVKQPFLITSHGVDIMTCREIGYGLRLKPINAFIIKLILKQSIKHVIVGKSMKKYALKAGSTPDKIIEINNGVPLINKIISREKCKSVFNKHDICSNDFVLLSLSGLRPLKGIEYLIMAMSLIVRKIPNAKLILACKSDNYENYIKNLVKTFNLEQNVKFIGFVTDEEEKIVLIRRSDVFCKPSLLEACSVAILEAMKEGKVVIASTPGGIDIITNGRNGILVRPKDHKDFANKAIEIFQDKKLREKIENNAKNDIINFDIKKTATKYFSLYKDII